MSDSSSIKSHLEILDIAQAALGSSISSEEFTPTARNRLGTYGAFEEWERLTVALGEALLPRIGQLIEELPAAQSVSVTTADGMNVCSVGATEEHVGASCALQSSLVAIADANASLLSRDSDAAFQHASISIGEGHLVLVPFEQPPFGALILGVFAVGASLGRIIHHAREFKLYIESAR